jgi:hypothetical protein
VATLNGRYKKKLRVQESVRIHTNSTMSDSPQSLFSQLSIVFSSSPSPPDMHTPSQHHSTSPTPSALPQRRPAPTFESPDGSGVARKRRHLTEEIDEDEDYSPAELETESEAESEDLDTELEELEAELEVPVPESYQMTMTNEACNRAAPKKRRLTSWIWNYGRWMDTDGGAYWVCNQCKKIIVMSAVCSD